MSLDKLDTENQRELVHPVLLVGEGKADVSFLIQLMRHRGLPDLHFGFPTDATGGFGFPGLGKFLSTLPARTGFSNLKALVVIYDNDSDPNRAFNDLVELVDPTDSYEVPATPMQLADANGDRVRLMFVPMPGVGVTGALETLLLQSSSGNAAPLACVEAFAICGACTDWAPSHQAKMKLRSLIAISCEGNSDMTLTHIWGKPGNPINLADTCFDALVASIAAVVAA